MSMTGGTIGYLRQRSRPKDSRRIRVELSASAGTCRRSAKPAREASRGQGLRFAMSSSACRLRNLAMRTATIARALGAASQKGGP
jgi:hypothetical protein